MNISKQSHIWKFIKAWGNQSMVYYIERPYAGSSDLCSLVKVFLNALLKCILVFSAVALIATSTIYNTVGCITFGMDFIRIDQTLGELGYRMFLFQLIFTTTAMFAYVAAVVLIVGGIFMGLLIGTQTLFEKIEKTFSKRTKKVSTLPTPNLIVEAAKGYIGKYCAIIKLVD